MPPPYPGINSPYARGASQQIAWGYQPGWANPNYNSQPMSQTGVYPTYGQPIYYGHS